MVLDCSWARLDLDLWKDQPCKRTCLIAAVLALVQRVGTPAGIVGKRRHPPATGSDLRGLAKSNRHLNQEFSDDRLRKALRCSLNRIDKAARQHTKKQFRLHVTVC